VTDVVIRRYANNYDVIYALKCYFEDFSKHAQEVGVKGAFYKMTMPDMYKYDKCLMCKNSSFYLKVFYVRLKTFHSPHVHIMIKTQRYKTG
jgi:hypothetical protein